MPDYFVNAKAQPSGDHEVHREGCPYMPKPKNRVPLGRFATCQGAVAAARRIFPTADGCYRCSRPCHRS